MWREIGDEVPYMCWWTALEQLLSTFLMPQAFNTVYDIESVGIVRNDTGHPCGPCPLGEPFLGAICFLHPLMNVLVPFYFYFFFLSLFFFQANQSFADPGDLPDTVREWLAEFKPNAEGHGGEIKTRMPKFKKPSWKSTTRSWKVEFALYYVQTIFSFYYIKYILLMIKTECICRLCTFSFFSNELLLLNCF